MAKEHQDILGNLRVILHSLDPGSNLYEAQIEAIECFKDAFKWQLQDDLPQVNIMTKLRRN